MRVWAKNVNFAIGNRGYQMTITITDIWEAMNNLAASYFEWLQAHPKYGLLFAVALLALWLVGLLRRWRWACEWQFHGKLWIFDDCKPETRRRVQIVVVSVALITCMTMFVSWR